MVVQYRAGHLVDFQLDKMGAQVVRAVLLPLITPDVVLCSDGAGAPHATRNCDIAKKNGALGPIP